MIQYLDDAPTYQPGACNIGPAEIRRRQMAGIMGVGAAVGLGALLLAVDAPQVSRFLVALPLGIGLSGFLQARARFCANYGWRGIRNLGAIGEAERVEDAKARREDRRKALSIFGAAALGASAAAAIFALLPL